MSRKIADSVINDCIKRNIAGENIGEIAKSVGVDRNVISKHVRSKGHKIIRHHRIAHNAKNFPIQDAIKMYISGSSVKSIASHYGVERRTIQDHLLRNGIKPRNRSEAMYARMANTSEEDRIRITKRANDATRGKPQCREQRKRMMVTRGRKDIAHFNGFGEDEIYEALVNSGFNVVRQKPVDIYNIDLTINGNIAMEILGSRGFNPFNKRHYLEKTKKLIKLGYFVFWVTWADKEALIGNISDIIADVDFISRNPSSFGQYRVVRCTAKRFTRFHDERGCFASKPSPIEFIYADRTKDTCIT